MFVAQHLDYYQTNSFTKIVTAYLEGNEALRSFYHLAPAKENIAEMIRLKSAQDVDRQKLVSVLQEQYAAVPVNEKVKANIEALLSPKTFTICTAHQPNLFTGPLYFIYKILHTIKMAAELNQTNPEYGFVPVYYMGSEDADFAELNHTWVDGKKLEWKKEQTGAVGRMVVDKTLVQLIDEMEGQLSVEAFGKEVVSLLRNAYTLGKTIQEATFELVHQLYGDYGLVVLIPDHAVLKQTMHAVFTDDLFNNKASGIVQATSEKLAQTFTAQAHPREINLFYLQDNIRERIVEEEQGFSVKNTDLFFTKEEMKKMLEEHPERFSPNVILRGLFQETILPNIAFVGGGGEIAYWLQLKDLFASYGVVFPMLVLRNSFLVVEKKWKQKIDRLGLSVTDLFLTEDELMKEMVQRFSEHQVTLNGSLQHVKELYLQIQQQASGIDATLEKHVAALQARSINGLEELEKKMMRAEKRKYGEQQRQIQSIKSALFPGNGLQERKENFSIFYAKWGRQFMEALFQNSLSLEQKFTVLMEN